MKGSGVMLFCIIGVVLIGQIVGDCSDEKKLEAAYEKCLNDGATSSKHTSSSLQEQCNKEVKAHCGKGNKMSGGFEDILKKVSGMMEGMDLSKMAGEFSKKLGDLNLSKLLEGFTKGK